MNSVRAAIIEAGVVVDVKQIPLFAIDDGQTAVIIPDDSPVEKTYLYDGSHFTENPDSVALKLAETKKREFISSIQDAGDLNELKTVVAAINSDINGA